MKFGWLTLAASPSPEEDGVRIDQQIAQACLAEELGFGDVWLTEHYFTGESVYNDARTFAAEIKMLAEAHIDFGGNKCNGRFGRCSNFFLGGRRDFFHRL